MHTAHEQGLVVDGLLLIIILAYLGIAFQFWARRRAARGQATAALAQLVVIFVFCAFCGYLPRLVAIPAPLLVAAHVVLATAAWAYFFSGQVDRLSLAVDGADRDDAASEQRRRDRAEAVDSEAEACARLADQVGSKVAANLIRERLAVRRDRAASEATGGESLQPAE
jgi:CBS domain containing-hemolysin-like protein